MIFRIPNFRIPNNNKSLAVSTFSFRIRNTVENTLDTTVEFAVVEAVGVSVDF